MSASASCPPMKQPVLLGLRDAAMVGPTPSTWTENKMGGLPTCGCTLTMLYPKCGVCNACLAHIVQIYCPLEGSPFDRVLNVFACGSKACWGKSESWKVLRCQYLYPGVKEVQDLNVQQKEVFAAKDWCEEADDWGMDETVEAPGLAPGYLNTLNAASVSPPATDMECAAQFQSLSLAERGGGLGFPGPLPMFQPHYISVVDEEDYTGHLDVGHAQKLLKEYQQREGVDVEELASESFAAKGEKEKYEKSETKNRDHVFHTFMKRISACPAQILRYSWKGQPLFMTSPPSSPPDLAPKCGTCGSRRVFELQLMPALVSMLTCAHQEGVSVEFGTVIVYTCEKSCWPADQRIPLEEFPIVQEDPDQRLFL